MLSFKSISPHFFVCCSAAGLAQNFEGFTLQELSQPSRVQTFYCIFEQCGRKGECNRTNDRRTHRFGQITTITEASSGFKVSLEQT